MEDDELFKQLESDENIAAAAKDHEDACSVQERSCIVCNFFQNIHELRQMAEAFDTEKILNLTDSPAGFLHDAQVVIQFLSEATQYFLGGLEQWEEEEEEEEEEEDE